MKTNIVKTVEEHKCCGCKSCARICPVNAIDIVYDQYGFIIPSVQNSKCISCSLCVKVCPVFSEIKRKTPVNAYAAVNKDSGVVFKSSSGGVFSALANAIINMNGAVCGATMDSSFNVYHKIIYKIDEIEELQKSKYVQSDLRDCFEKIKQEIEKKKVLFVGTPCQVAALYSYMGMNDNLITVDLVCHGVPNQLFFTDYLAYLSKNKNDVERYTFRAKKCIENGMNWFFSYKRTGQKERIDNWPCDSYNFFYMKGYTYRDSCYDCKYTGKERWGDITLCDYWGWKEYHHGQFGENESISGIMVNSGMGNQLFEASKEKLRFVHTKSEYIIRHNQSIIKTMPYNTERDKILTCWKEHGYSAVDKKFKTENRKTIYKYKLMNSMPGQMWKVVEKVKKWKQG